MDSEVTADTTVFSGEAEHDYVNVGLYIAPFGRGKFYAESGFQLRAERSRLVRPPGHRDGQHGGGEEHEGLEEVAAGGRGAHRDAMSSYY